MISYLFAHCSGGSWRSPHAGGGSGGSIWIETELFDGDGAIDAGGGEGYSGSAGNHGGGGAGGRVAIYYTNNNFIGIVLSNFKFNINFISKTYIKKRVPLVISSFKYYYYYAHNICFDFSCLFIYLFQNRLHFRLTLYKFLSFVHQKQDIHIDIRNNDKVWHNKNRVVMWEKAVRPKNILPLIQKNPA